MDGGIHRYGWWQPPVLLHIIVQSGVKVLVHCHAGQSRYVMIAAMY